MKKLLSILTLVIVAHSSLAFASNINTSAKQALVFDFETGAILLDKNADKKMPTSSMSKVITAYAIFDALKVGTIKLDDTFKVSEKAWRKGGSKMFIEQGKQVAIEDLLRGVIIQSGNDATIALAEGLSGSEETFAQGLNDIAQKLGMSDSNFKNASGWPDPDHYSTAKDLGKLAVALIQNHPKYYKYYAEKEFTYNEITQTNRNPLLYQDIGADGIKTGHTNIGGYGLMGSAKNNGRRVVIVINGLESTQDRAQESKKLMRWGLNSFQNKTVVKAGDIIGEAAVLLGKAETISLVAGEDIFTTIPINSDQGIKTSMNINEPIPAPIEQGQKVGTFTISIPNQADIVRPLLAGQSIEEKGFISKTIHQIKTMVGDLI